MYLLRVVALLPTARMPTAEVPAPPWANEEQADAAATPQVVLVQDAYVYLLRAVPPPLIWTMPRVLLPTAFPPQTVALDAATPAAVDVQQAYVYLSRVVVVLPMAKMPRVLLPAAAPPREAALDTATPDAVEVHDANVYLFRVVLGTPQLLLPSAKMPRVPSRVQPKAPNPKARTDIAPRVMMLGIT